MSKVQVVATAWLVGVLAVLAVHVFAPQRTGVFALTQVLEPYIVLSGLIASAFLIHGPSVIRAMAVVLIVVTLVRYVPTWVSTPVDPGGDTLSVVSWNMEAGPDAASRALNGFSGREADLIGIQELQGDSSDALLADSGLTARLPYSVMAPDSSVLGIGLLSRFPIAEERVSTDPPFIRALVDPPTGTHIAVYVVHPLPARFVSVAGMPVALDTTRRDAAITTIRSLIDEDLAAGIWVLVLGDINTTQREPAYAELSAGLRDSHLDVGLGPGNTWRPGSLGWLPFGMLRIDYVFASTGFNFVSTGTDCSLPSDHCLIQAVVRRGSEF